MSRGVEVSSSIETDCVQNCVCALVCVCLTCDPGATLATYGSNWAARKLTKCQWSAMPQEVIDCGPQGQ